MRSKLKEPSRVNVVPLDARSDVKFFGPLDLDDWLDNTARIVKEERAKCIDAGDFLLMCELKGLRITYPETFLRIYWYKKTDKREHKREWKEIKS